MTNTQLALASHIANFNKGRDFAMCDNVQSWNDDYDVFTPADFDKYLAMCDVFEMTRAMYDYKPNWLTLKSKSIEELQADYESMLNQERLEREYKEEVKELENPERYRSSGEPLTANPFAIL